MNGAESLVRTLVAGGVDVCFANPGTSEMHFVAALDRVEGMRCVLGLFEGVVTGAADGYFRMKGTPASTLLHLGPGLANGLANLHNAKKANSGIVNIVGQHAVYHIGFNAPLTSDIEGLARPMSAWVRTSPDAKSVSADGAAAIAAAKSAPPQIATLILPADTAWNEADGIAQVPVESQRISYSPQAVDNAAKVMRGGAQTLLSLLKDAGFPATQATVSRDIVELGLVKVARDGAHVYAPPTAISQGGGTDRLRRFSEDYPVEAAVAANMVVLRSSPGTANALGAALDASGLSEILGTLAGDDTVFVATSTERHARSLLTRLTAFGIARREKA